MRIFVYFVAGVYGYGFFIHPVVEFVRGRLQKAKKASE
jgi:hypothetical protein